MTAGVEQVRALVAQGRWQEAKAACETLEPATRERLDVLSMQGMIHARLGEFAAAVGCFGQAAQRYPDVAAVQHDLGMMLKQVGRTQDAITALRKAVELNADFIDAWCNLANLTFISGQREQAVSLLTELLPAHGRDTRILIRLGILHLRMRNFTQAEHFLRQALKQQPDNSNVLYNLAQALRGRRLYDEAIQIVQRLLDENTTDVDLRHLMGVLMHDTGQEQASLSWFDRALATEPNNAVIWYSRGTACQALGHLDEAIANYREAIRCNPDYTEAYRAISITKEFRDPTDPDLASIESMLKNSAISAENRMHFQFALAKIHEDLGDFDRAFHYCSLGNAAKRATIDYSIESERAYFDKLSQCLTPAYIEQRTGFVPQDNDRIPVFIVGMPRSGTTLLEQILASHPDVYGAGELSALQDVLNRMAGLRQPDFVDRLGRLGREDLVNMAAAYQNEARRNCTGLRFVTDKLPSNYLYVGLIYLMFPQARVIHCRRDPADTCLSCYKRLFGSDIKYAYDLTELGQTYCLYQDYMNYWHTLLPGFIYDVQYEDLVADQEKESRRLLEFCGLPWDDRCLSFYDTERVVKTSSFAQVRKPIYRSSVQLWKCYEKYLQPLLDELERCGAGQSTVNRSRQAVSGQRQGKHD